MPHVRNYANSKWKRIEEKLIYLFHSSNKSIVSSIWFDFSSAYFRFRFFRSSACPFSPLSMLLLFLSLVVQLIESKQHRNAIKKTVSLQSQSLQFSNFECLLFSPHAKAGESQCALHSLAINLQLQRIICNMHTYIYLYISVWEREECRRRGVKCSTTFDFKRFCLVADKFLAYFLIFWGNYLAFLLLGYEIMSDMPIPLYSTHNVNDNQVKKWECNNDRGTAWGD